MSKPQDFFGAAPKTVLNKPFLHVEERQPTGTHAGASSVGWNDRTPNTVLVNDISGSSLSAGEVTLPAGKYYIEGFGIARDGTAGTGRLHVRTSADANLLVGATTYIYLNTTLKVAGEINLSSTTTIKLSQYHQQAEASYGLGSALSVAPHEVYADLRIWKLDSNIETPVVSDPTMVLARPLLHVQDQKASGTDGGTSVIGDNDRDLNTVVTNEISGASLSSNEITLPAGDYYIESSSMIGTSAGTSRCQQQLKTSAGTVLLVGHSMSAGQYGWARVFLGGNLTLATQTTFKLSTFSSTAKDTSGLGIAGSGGETEIYSDLKVWQLDALRQTPVIVNDKLYPLPSNTYVTGNMHGLEYAYTSASTITVQPGICMDSTNQVVLDKSIAQVVTIPSAINTVYNLFLCDDDTVRTDTDVDGANLSAYDIRWIGFVVTDGSGNLRTFVMSGDKYQSDDPSNSILQTLSTTRATLDISLLAPPSRVSGIEMGVYSPNSDNVQYTDDFYVGSGTTKIGRVGTNPAYGGNVWLSGGGEQDGSFIAWKTGGIEHQGSHNTNSLCLRAVKLRR